MGCMTLELADRGGTVEQKTINILIISFCHAGFKKKNEAFYTI